jgi:hypothetical protein
LRDTTDNVSGGFHELARFGKRGFPIRKELVEKRELLCAGANFDRDLPQLDPFLVRSHDEGRELTIAGYQSSSFLRVGGQEVCFNFSQKNLRLQVTEQ